MNREDLNKTLNEHKLWIDGNGGKRAYLQGADLQGAYLQGAYLQRAHLQGADLQGAYLQGADLQGAYLRGAYGLSQSCPEEGSFVGFKKCQGDRIVKLEILTDAKRSSASSRKCRCDKAKVLNITSVDGLQEFENAISKRDSGFIYQVGKVVSVDDFDDDRWNECASGVHFFITKQEAVDY